MRKLLMSILMGTLLFGCAENKTVINEKLDVKISAQQAKQIIDDSEGYIILDVRTQEEFDSGHIPNAICIPNETIDASIESQLKDKDQLILIYCRSGNRSNQASNKLSKLGYTNIKDFGGIIDWPYDIIK